MPINEALDGLTHEECAATTWITARTSGFSSMVCQRTIGRTVTVGNYSLFAGAETRWNDWFRTEAGVRADLFYFDVESDDPRDSGNKY